MTRPNPSTHEEGRAIDVFFRPYQDADNRRHGWALAHWLVANADRLDVGVIIYRDQIWSARRSPEGWRDYVSPFGDPKDPDTAAPRPHPRRGRVSPGSHRQTRTVDPVSRDSLFTQVEVIGHGVPS